jgi:protein O-GlcNAc transferase
LADPPGIGDRLCGEHLYRLPRTAWCYQPDEADSICRVKHARTNGPITFGSFNNFSKVTRTMLELWARILQSIPNSKLIIKAKALSCPSVQRSVLQVMANAGVDSDRLQLQGWRQTHEEHLHAYHDVDIALDTFPYHGTTTTCEALWMGVPVVTLAGTAHVSRVGVSLLTNAGLPELIADSSEEYVRIASELAGNHNRLDELHSGLRERMRCSPLMDIAAFAQDMDAAFRQMWRNWCASQPTKSD